MLNLAQNVFLHLRVVLNALDRRDFMKSLVASVAAPAVAASAMPEPQRHTQATVRAPRKQAKPNVLLMICDGLGYGDPHCDGSNLPTPSLDAMAEHGLRFTHYNAAAPHLLM